jgi:hypothetical protein
MKDKLAFLAKLAENLGSPAVVIPSVEAPESKSNAQASSKITKQPKKRGSSSLMVRKPVPISSPSKPLLSSSTTGSGKQAAFWLDDEDRAILHEMGMLLYSQGVKPSHNLVIRAAIRMVPKDHRLFEKIQELIEQDGRKIRHRK